MGQDICKISLTVKTSKRFSHKCCKRTYEQTLALKKCVYHTQDFMLFKKRINFLLDLSKSELDFQNNFLKKKNQTVEKHYKDKEAVFVYQSQINKKKYIILNTLTQ